MIQYQYQLLIQTWNGNAETVSAGIGVATSAAHFESTEYPFTAFDWDPSDPDDERQAVEHVGLTHCGEVIDFRAWKIVTTETTRDMTLLVDFDDEARYDAAAASTADAVFADL